MRISRFHVRYISRLELVEIDAAAHRVLLLLFFMAFDPRQKAAARLSLSSCLTDDSADSASLSTPLDASPCAPPSTTFPTITVVADESYPTRPHIPNIAASAASSRRRRHLLNQTALWPRTPASPVRAVPPPVEAHARPVEAARPLWPRIKQMVTSSATKKGHSDDPQKGVGQLSSLVDSSMRISVPHGSKKQSKERGRRWFRSHKSRVGPQEMTR